MTKTQAKYDKFSLDNSYDMFDRNLERSGRNSMIDLNPLKKINIIKNKDTVSSSCIQDRRTVAGNTDRNNPMYHSMLGLTQQATQDLSRSNLDNFDPIAYSNPV